MQEKKDGEGLSVGFVLGSSPPSLFSVRCFHVRSLGFGMKGECDPFSNTQQEHVQLTTTKQRHHHHNHRSLNSHSKVIKQNHQAKSSSKIIKQNHQAKSSSNQTQQNTLKNTLGTIAYDWNGKCTV
jgi:hypothetical protein